MEMKPIAVELNADQLAVELDVRTLPFQTTAELADFHGVVGQTRALSALEFGLSMNRPGYNIFVMGRPGSGRLSLTMEFLNRREGSKPVPNDWVFLNDFAKTREPKAHALPAGAGKALLADFESLVDALIATFPAVFDHPAFQRRKSAIDKTFAAHFDQAIAQVEARARGVNVLLYREGETITFSPMKNGEGASEDEFDALPEDEKEAFHRNAKALEEFLGDCLLELPQWKRRAFDEQRELIRETVDRATEPLFTALTEKYADQPAVVDYLNSVRGHLLRTADQMLIDHTAESREEASRRTMLLDLYAPNLFVSRQADCCVPILHEPNPTYSNVFGRIEYNNEQGVWLTHHRLIFPGALHRANGGYLVLEAEKLLGEPAVWPALKRALQSRCVRFEFPERENFIQTAVGLRPEAVPLDVKLVLIGDRELYYLMQQLDPEFSELFRVLADFDDELPRDAETVLELIRLVKTQAAACGFAPMTAGAAAELIRYSARLADHQQRLSAHIGEILELLGESDAVRIRTDAALIGAEHVLAALEQKRARGGRISDRLLQEILDGVLLIDVDGAAVGRINGLTVLEVGDSHFGCPARITATVSPGGRGVVDIEREVELGLPIHSKGVMILAGYLSHRYAVELPLAITANIAIEQSYGDVDGDSASLAEVLALISALTRLGLRQSLAVTGSLNQHGDVQAVGGVNEKIEGFFRLCLSRGLTGAQGVMIPRANVPNLMLDRSVIDAVRAGKFAVYAVSSVDDALTLATGRSARMVNAAVINRLRAFNRKGGGL